MDRAGPRISVVVVCTYEYDLIERCVRSVTDGEPGTDVEVIVVKNNADPVPPVLERLQTTVGVKVVDAGANLGFPGACARGVDDASGRVLFFLNPDAVAAPGAVSTCADLVEKDPTIGVAMARLLLLSDPARLNTGGNVVHVSGLAWCGDYGEPADSISELAEVAYPSGAGMAITRELYDHVGGMTPEYFLYHDDLELGWKARMAGHRCVVTPAADVMHDYEFSRNTSKLYYVERNRYLFVLAAFSGRLLALLAPVLLATEVAMWLLAWRQGWLAEKARSWRWILGHLGWIRRKRAQTQAIRTTADRDLAPWLSTALDPQMVDVPGVSAVANPMLAAYWAVVRRLL